MGTATPTPSRGSTMTVSLGLVNVTVKYAPFEQTEKRLAGKFLDPATLTPVRQQYVNEKGEPVEKVTGYPFGDGFVVPDPESIRSLELERDSRLEVKAFVEPDTVDPIYLSKAYLVWPTKGQEAGYDLLCETLARTGRVIVGTTIIRKSTKAVMLRYGQGCLVLHVCAYDENMAWGDHKLVTMARGERPEPDEALLEIALQLFSGLPEEFDFSSVHDEYDQRLRAAIDTLGKGGKIAKPEPEAELTPVADLMEALKASVAAAGQTDEAPKRKSRTKKVAA